MQALPHSKEKSSKEGYILVLHSIHFNETWTLGIYETTKNTFAKEGFEVKGEELLIPTIKDTTEINEKLRTFREKYAKKPRLIICIGDPAWLICKPLFDREWKDVSTIICYSRELIPSNVEHLIKKEIQGKQIMVPAKELFKGYNLTTLTQPFYIKETILTMQKLQPELKRLAFIGDNRYISLCVQQEVRQTVKEDFPHLQLDILSTLALSTENLLDTLSTYGKETGIIYYSWFVPKNNKENHYLIDNVQKMTNSFSNPPVFLLADMEIENGNYAGGNYISTEDFGKSLIATIRKILAGKEARDIQPHVGGANRTYLNYQHLLSHGINPSTFPQHAIYYQQPPTFIQKYKIHLISALTIFILLCVVATLRFRLYIQRLKQEKERREKEKAEEANRLKTAFLANMSHEIRTPLNAIVGFSNLIAHAESPENTEQFCNIIETNNELLLQLINDILDLSKIEAGQLEFVYSNIDVSAMLSTLAQTFKHKIKEGVTLDCILPERNCFIHSEKNRLAQVITNFLTNACKFTSKGYIKMGYEETENGLRFYVTDTGKGIVKENVPHVFERFAKFDPFIQGTGLGLSICQMIVRHLKGEIGVDSEEGKGSTFWFTIPCEVHYEEPSVTSVSTQ